MKQFNNRFILITIYSILYTSLFLLFVPRAHAQLPTLPTSGLTGASGVVEIQALEQVFANVLNIATSLAGLAAFIVLVSGGYKWMTSSGDPKKVESAKSSITYALAGLVLLILIWFILLFISNFTELPDLLHFQIPR